MRIAYVHGSEIPSQSANSVHVMKMCAALADEGAELVLFCPKSDVESDPFIMYGVQNNFKICFISPIGFLNRIPVLKSLYIAYKTAKTVKNSSFDYVFGRSTMAIFFLRKKIRYIYESHMLPPNRFRKMLEKSIFRSKNLICHIVITELLKQDYISTYSFVDSEKIAVLHDAADKGRSTSNDIIPDDFSKRLKISTFPVIGYLGHLYPGKCMEILSQMAKMRPQYDFHVVGGKQEWVNKWMKDERCQDLKNIIFYGYIENKTIPYYYNLFDICILPFSNQIYIGNSKKIDIGRWTSPLKLFEAMAYSKPILTTNLCTIREVMTDGVNCLMEQEKNIEGWCAKLDRLVEDEKLRNQLGESARIHFERNYTWNIRAKRIIDILKRENNEN